MFEGVKNLEIISAITKVSNRYGRIDNRKMHTFNIRASGTMEYDFGEKKILVKEGEMIYLPKGCTYKNQIVSEGDSVCTIINMQGDFGTVTPASYSLQNFHHIDSFLSNFADLWNFGNASEKYMCISQIYDLLTYICNYESLNYPDKKKFKIIESAVEYLKKHIYDSNLKIDKLHQLCGISHTYFSKIFLLEFGMSPKEYITERRMAHAKVIIDSGEMDSVKQLALSVGYTDALYFSKVFKKHYGMSPTIMNNME